MQVKFPDLLLIISFIFCDCLEIMFVGSCQNILTRESISEFLDVILVFDLAIFI